MKETADAVIIGAGIVGAACAEALTRDGLRVTLIESSAVGGGATAAGMGHVVVMDDSEAQFTLTRYSRDLWNSLVPQLPPEVEFEARGTLWVAADDKEYVAVRQKEAYYTARGVRAEALDARALAAAEPNLRSGLAGALLIPDDSVIYAPCAAQWLASQAIRRGASLKLGAEVVELTATNGSITLHGAEGLNFSVGDGDDDSAITITGTLADINVALDGLSFNPANGFTGLASLRITTNDQGLTGLGGPRSSGTSTVVLQVVAASAAWCSARILRHLAASSGLSQAV